MLLGALAAGATAGLVAERYFVGRDRRRPDPEAKEPFGQLRGEPATLTSFDGTRLHIETHGPAAAPTLVLVHGFSLNLKIWHYQVRDLPPSHRLVVYDARGHGRSEKARDGDWSLDALARDLEAVVREHGGPNPLVLVGHSMGGMTVMRFCEMFPEQIGTRVGGLTLVNTTAADVMGGMLPGAARRATAAIQMIQEGAVRALASNAGRVDRLRGRSRDLAYLAVRTMGLGPKALPSVVEFVESVLAETPTEVWASLIPPLLGMDVSKVLELIDVPTLIVAGSHDRLTPTGAAARMANAIKGAELSMIHDAGHMSMLERPNSFNARLRAFLSRVPALAG